MYCRGLGLGVVGRFEHHDGFDGVMLGLKDSSYHFEFTRCRTHPVAPAPTPEDLLVFYVPAAAEWQTSCASMLAAGFKQVSSFNPGARILREKTVRSPPGRISWQLKMPAQTKLIAGSPRQRLFLERLEPCEGETFMHGSEGA